MCPVCNGSGVIKSLGEVKTCQCKGEYLNSVWRCPLCKDLNKAKRITCHKCSYIRDKDKRPD